MTCKFWIPSGSTWAEFGTVLMPTRFTRTLGSTEGAYTIILSHTTDQAILKPSQICQLDFGDGYTEYFVIVDGGKVSRKGGSSYKHQYTVQELICYFREVKVQLGFFTGSLYSALTFFERLIAMTDCKYTIALGIGGDYSSFVTNWVQADYQVASQSFLDNIIKIGLNNRVRFKATFNPSVNEITLTAYSLLGSTTITSISGTLSGNSEQVLGANYASIVSSVANNVAADQFKWWPSYSFTTGARGEPSDPYAIETTADDIVLVCSHNIRSARTLRIIGFDRLNLDSAISESPGTGYTYYDANDDEILAVGDFVYWENDVQGRNTTGRISEFDIVEYQEWLLLDETGTGSQADTLYYKRGENKIFNLKICDGSGTSANTDYIYKKVTESNITTYRYQEMIAHRNFYSVEVNFYNDGEIVFTNGINDKRTAFYSQEENQAAGKSLVSNMQGYIDGMKNSDVEYSYIFTDFTDIPALGGIYNGMVLNTITIEAHPSHYAVLLKFSDDLVPKSEYLSADDGITLPAIPLEKAYDRITNYRTTVWLCATQAQASALVTLYGADIYFDAADHADTLLNAVENRTTSAPIPLEEVQIRTGDGASTYVYTATQTLVSALGGSLIVNFKSIDNSIIGRMADETGGTAVGDIRFFPVSFINSTGETERFYFKIKFGTSRGNEANYPAITSTTFASDTGVVAEVNDAYYYHDPAERFIITYQVNCKTYETGKVTQAFIEESQFFRDTFFASEIYTRKCLVNGTLRTVTAVSITNVATNVYEVKCTLDGYSAGTPATNVPLVFKRVNNSTSAEETMLEIIGSKGNQTGDDYVAFYAAFTK